MLYVNYLSILKMYSEIVKLEFQYQSFFLPVRGRGKHFGKFFKLEKYQDSFLKFLKLRYNSFKGTDLNGTS